MIELALSFVIFLLVFLALSLKVLAGQRSVTTGCRAAAHLPAEHAPGGRCSCGAQDKDSGGSGVKVAFTDFSGATLIGQTEGQRPA